MLNTSLRRVARQCPNSPLPNRPSTPTPITASFSSQTHQRRHSSSKRPVPPSSSHSSIPATQVKTVGAKKEAQTHPKIPGTPVKTEATGTIDVTKKREPGLSRLFHRKEALRGKKDYSNEWLLNVPSVAPTNHLKREDVHASSFYSIHRPLAINTTSGLPNETTLESFNALFEPKPKAKRSRTNTTDVLYTLSSAVHNLDEHIAQQQRKGPPRGPSNRADIITALTRHNEHAPKNASGTVKHLDSPNQQQFPQSPSQNKSNTQVSIAIADLARRFRPFNTPPVPIPMSDVEIAASEHIETENAKYAAEQEQEEMQSRELEEQVRLQDQDDELLRHSQTPRGRRVLRDFFTPRIRIEAPSRESFEIQTPSPGGRMRIRRTPVNHMRIGIREDRKYFMISVRRQRKLKMKKHKYKKLMRKTRNLRRRMDKL